MARPNEPRSVVLMKRDWREWEVEEEEEEEGRGGGMEGCIGR